MQAMLPRSLGRKSCGYAGLERSMMQSSSRESGVTGNAHQLSTRTSLFSTRYAQAIHVRDLVFVKRTPDSTYLGTGADSRVGLASAPAMKMQPAASLPTKRSYRAPRVPLHAPGKQRHAITV